VPGRVIVVEGLDGVGKTTLSQGLAAALGATWLTTPPKELRPHREPFDAMFRKSPAASQLFYAATVLAVGQQADELRAGGVDVVIDRYWATTRAYSRVRGSPLDLGEVEAILPAADVTVLVDLDEDERRARLLARGATELDRETLDPTRARALRMALRAELVGRVSGRSVLLDVTGLGEGEAVALAVAEVDRWRGLGLFLAG
jgi:dTMP kinase